ncbi:hypothetical protein [Sulfobacillus harzensis]|uniref:Uncharacterized protein n=1 Tax=Sulfobacillus harzensis TaxID=2729629 RepID=A0A7Y0Q393_9FIRM|nr:hypothetical protein [Sulfobacillus harzensis]NMP23165.1 hypothetical protein [Sulfobacillus harzensis]
MSHSTPLAICLDCLDTISAIDILTTHQAKRCPQCHKSWRKRQQEFVDERKLAIKR